MHRRVSFTNEKGALEYTRTLKISLSIGSIIFGRSWVPHDQLLIESTADEDFVLGRGIRLTV